MTAPGFYVQVALWSQVIAAVLFMGVLVWLWLKYIQPAILAAQERYNMQIAQAERHRDEAKAALELLRDQIEGAAHDAELIKERAAEQASREHAGAVAETREAGERALRNADGELGRARAAASELLRDEILSKALLRARAVASDRVDAAANARLVDRFVGSLESVDRLGTSS